MTVVEVVDGDTLTIAYRNGTADTVRLLGIDTPEVHAENTPDEFEGVPDTQAGGDCLRAEGEDASSHVTDVLGGETITIQFDDQADRRGYYGRLLAYVVHDGQNVNYHLVDAGYARVYDSRFSQRDRFYASEDAAQAAEIGVWRCRTVTTATPSPTPTDSGGDGGPLVVVEMHEDAAGNDHENENDEYVVFENRGATTLDLGGWTVRDEADHVYTFPGGISVEPGEEITLYTGSGTDANAAVYWGSGSAIWNNGGDTVYVSTDRGELVEEFSYA